MSTTPLIEALELDQKGNWDAAHRIVQDIETITSYRIHAYLHRKEGDLSNANYWYTRAGASMPNTTLDEEWRELYAAQQQ